MDENRYREALRNIARIAGQAAEGHTTSPDSADGFDIGAGCHVMPLPPRLHVKAAEVAAAENPVNAPLQELLVVGEGVLTPQRLTFFTTKYWGPKPKALTVSFMETTAADLRARIVSHLNAWAQYGGISFVETSGTGDVRISRGPGGYWSYLGTDIKLIPQNRPTMNLQGFSMSTEEKEYRRVVRHEAGHTLGFPHEHMRQALVERIDRQKAYDYFWRTQGWSKEMVDQQVLTPLDPSKIMGTEPDQDSIMCYRLPGEITKDGQPIRGGADINTMDGNAVAIIYPKVLRAADVVPTTGAEAEVPTPRIPVAVDWDPSEDVASVS
ncbi:M12 family metallopeptidase [Geodermatophilus sp. SYSU D00710]